MTKETSSRRDRWFLLTTLARRLRSSMNDGRGEYFVSVIFFALSVASLKQTINLAQPERARTEALQRLLPTMQEPLRDEPMPVIAALFTSSLDNWSLCEKEHAGSIYVLDDLSRFFDWQFLHPEVVDACKDAIFSSFRFVKRFHDEKKIKSFCHSPVGEVKLLAVSGPITKGVGHALEEHVSNSVLRIPSLVATAGMFSPRYTRAITNSRVIESLKGLEGEPVLMDEPDATTPQFKGFYFISVDGVLRYVGGESLSVQPHRLFHHASYFQSTLAEGGAPLGVPCRGTRGSYHSRPYLDLLGAGIVSTVCYPVEDPRSNNQLLIEETTGIGPMLKRDRGVDLVNALKSALGANVSKPSAGVFCIDISVPRETIYSKLVQALDAISILDLAFVSTRGGGMDEMDEYETANACGGPGQECPQGFRDAHDDPKAKAAIEALASQWHKRVKRSIGAGPSGVVLLKDESTRENVYAAALARSNSSSGNVTEVGLIRMKPGEHSAAVAFYATMALLSAILGVSVIAVARDKQLRRQESTLARGLPTALIRVRADGTIREANDMAEELLQRRLPRLGMVHARREKEHAAFNFDQILRSCKLVKREGASWKEISYQDVEGTRRSGLASEYYAEYGVGGKLEWLRILGAPIMTASGDRETFGILEPADPVTSASLNQEFNSTEK